MSSRTFILILNEDEAMKLESLLLAVGAHVRNREEYEFVQHVIVLLDNQRNHVE